MIWLAIKNGFTKKIPYSYTIMINQPGRENKNLISEVYATEGTDIWYTLDVYFKLSDANIICEEYNEIKLLKFAFPWLKEESDTPFFVTP